MVVIVIWNATDFYFQLFLFPYQFLVYRNAKINSKPEYSIVQHKIDFIVAAKAGELKKRGKCPWTVMERSDSHSEITKYL